MEKMSDELLREVYLAAKRLREVDTAKQIVRDARQKAEAMLDLAIINYEESDD
jgi:hypothetical protein